MADDTIMDLETTAKLNSNNIMDVYLKKHSLDLKVLPNKNMIKLSDLRPKAIIVDVAASTQQNKDGDTRYSAGNESLSFDEEEEEEDDDDHDSDDEDEVDNSSEALTSTDNSNNTSHHPKRVRKKREPSLKLQQKLTNQDLELIVECVKARHARLYIADVKKNDYVDKILRIVIEKEAGELCLLSNGRREALLKKSMFPKELNSLFETFVSSLCGQEFITDERGSQKPILKCLVDGCEFRSLSEAEINRHIKRCLKIFLYIIELLKLSQLTT